MSHEATRWAWRTKAEHGARLVLLALADHHNGATGLCCPSIARLTDATRLERKAVLRGIRDLEDAGLVRADHRPGIVTRYALMIEDQSQNGTGDKMGPVPKGDSTSPKMGPDQSQNGTRNQEVTGNESGNLPSQPPAGQGEQRNGQHRGTPQEPQDTLPGIDAPSKRKNPLAPPPNSKGKAPKKRCPLIDALLVATGTPDPTKTTPGEVRKAAVAIGGIMRAMPDVTVEEIHRRAENYQSQWPNVALTPHALAKHWARFANGDPRKEMERLRKEIQQHPANSSSAYHDANATEEQRADLKAKRKRFRELGGDNEWD